MTASAVDCAFHVGLIIRLRHTVIRRSELTLRGRDRNRDREQIEKHKVATCRLSEAGPQLFKLQMFAGELGRTVAEAIVTWG